LSVTLAPSTFPTRYATPPPAIPIRTGRIKLPLGTVTWHEGGNPQGETILLLHGSWHDNTQWLPLMQAMATFQQL